MTSSHSSQGTPLFSEAELDAMVVRIDATRSVRSAKDAVTEFREFHGWTLNKLDVFELYLKLYRRVAGGGAFIDAFAGTGLGISARSKSSQRDGSSMIAAKSDAFSRLDLIEKDAQYIDTLGSTIRALPTRQINKIKIHHGDCNIIIPQLLNSDKLDASRPCFALLDQESTQLDWHTIERLAEWKIYEPPATMTGRPKMCKVELWILFNSHQVIYRLWPHDRNKYPKSRSPETLDRVFGSRDGWWDLWKNQRPASMLVTRFADQLRALGYQYVLPQQINDPNSGRPQYHMLHATDHPSAIEFMRWAKRRTDGYENQHLPGLGSST